MLFAGRLLWFLSWFCFRLVVLLSASLHRSFFVLLPFVSSLFGCCKYWHFFCFFNVRVARLFFRRRRRRRRGKVKNYFVSVFVFVFGSVFLFARRAFGTGGPRFVGCRPSSNSFARERAASCWQCRKGVIFYWQIFTLAFAFAIGRHGRRTMEWALQHTLISAFCSLVFTLERLCRPCAGGGLGFAFAIVFALALAPCTLVALVLGCRSFFWCQRCVIVVGHLVHQRNF